MAKLIQNPIDLSFLDPNLEQLIGNREKYFVFISKLFKQAQNTLDRCKLHFNDFPSFVDENVGPDEITSFIDDLDKKLVKLEKHDKVIELINAELKNQNLIDKLRELQSKESELVKYHKGELTHDILSKYSPKTYQSLERVINLKAELQITVNKIDRELSSWWERVVVEFFRNIFNIDTKAGRLYILEQDLEKLTKDEERLELKARQESLSHIGKLINDIKASISELKTNIEKDSAKWNQNHVRAQSFRFELIDKLRKSRDKLHNCLHNCRIIAIKKVIAYTSEITEYISRLPPATVMGWQAVEWNSWPSVDEKGRATLHPVVSDFLRIGEIREQIQHKLSALFDGEFLSLLVKEVRALTLPVGIPFIGKGRTIVVVCDERSRDENLELIHALIIRTSAMLGRQVKFTFLDPVGHGQAFPVQRFLDARPTEDINKDLKDVQQDIRRINQNVLTGEVGLHELDKRRLASEQFEVIVAAGFPNPSGFDRRSVETLFNIGMVGPRAGRYVFLHYDKSKPLPREYPIDSLTNAFIFDPKLSYLAPVNYKFYLDMAPSIGEQQALLERIKEAGKVDYSLSWDDVIKPERDSDWWTGSSETEISTPIGLRGGADKAIFWLGQNSSGEVCSHGVLAGMTGSGKSTLYHDLILGLATRYSPDELKLYLIDLKQGVEFQPYKDLPHAVVLSLSSPAELTLSILFEMEREMETRNQIFKSAGVGSYTEYRRKGNLLPRILMFIDEYQRLFTDDLAEAASGVLLRLAQQGRSAGLHMFLGSQSFGAPGMLNQSAIFANFHLRVAMKLQPSTIAGLSEFGPIGKRLIRDITMAGKFVLNDSGQDERTIDGQAALLKPERRNELIITLKNRKKELPGPEVFDGDAPTDLFSNKALQNVLSQREMLNSKMLETIARKEEGYLLGFGQQRWVAADRPLGIWLGRRFNVHGHTMAVLPRNVQQNLIIVGSPAEARAGILAGLLASLAVLNRPSEIEIDLVHAGGDDEDASLQTCEMIINNLQKKVGHTANFTRDISVFDSLLNGFDDELAVRKEKGSRDSPSRLLIILEPDRISLLRRVGDLGVKLTPHQEKFRRLLSEGSQYGLHVLMVFSVFSLVPLVIDKRKDLVNFAHRVGFQMSQNDSYDFFGNYKATNLQNENNKVPIALYQNTEMNDSIRFKPYAVPDPIKILNHSKILCKIYAGLNNLGDSK